MAGARGQRLKRPPAVARVLERVTATAREHEMFLPGETVLVACSGGPDSTCLLYSLHRLRRLFKIELAVFHLDHGLRPDSPKDADYVMRQAAKLGLPSYVRTVNEPGPRKGESVEAWGRVMRLSFLGDVRRETGAERIAEGHTLDDQAETLLIAMIRGGGLQALGGIEPVLGGRHVQPLIDVTRDEVEAFCRALHLRPRQDPMNRDTKLLRNAVRLKVIPSIERAVGRDVRSTFARTADLLRRDEHELGHAALIAGEELVAETPTGFDIDAAGLLGLGPAIAARVVRRALIGARTEWTEESIDAVLDLAAGRPGRTRDLPGGLKAVRDREYVRLDHPSPRSTSGRKGKM